MTSQSVVLTRRELLSSAVLLGRSDIRHDSNQHFDAGLGWFVAIVRENQNHNNKICLYLELSRN